MLKEQMQITKKDQSHENKLIKMKTYSNYPFICIKNTFSTCDHTNQISASYIPSGTWNKQTMKTLGRNHVTLGPKVRASYKPN